MKHNFETINNALHAFAVTKSTEYFAALVNEITELKKTLKEYLLDTEDSNWETLEAYITITDKDKYDKESLMAHAHGRRKLIRDILGISKGNDAKLGEDQKVE